VGGAYLSAVVVGFLSLVRSLMPAHERAFGVDSLAPCCRSKHFFVRNQSCSLQVEIGGTDSPIQDIPRVKYWPKLPVVCFAINQRVQV